MQVRWELKNKKTGRLYWLTDSEMTKLKGLGFTNRYIITEITPVTAIKDPLKFAIKKSTKNKKRD